ncbi:MAG: hypothetical protein AAGA31_21680, partial [Bacteroidota bacterium]
VAGQQLHLSQGQLLLDTIPPQTTTPGWLEGGIRYRDAAPEEVFQEMERQFGLSINYPDLGSQRYNGLLPLTDARQALRIVCEPLQLSFTFRDSTTVIIAPLE